MDYLKHNNTIYAFDPLTSVTFTFKKNWDISLVPFRQIEEKFSNVTVLTEAETNLLCKGKTVYKLQQKIYNLLNGD